MRRCRSCGAGRAWLKRLALQPCTACTTENSEFKILAPLCWFANWINIRKFYEMLDCIDDNKSSIVQMKVESCPIRMWHVRAIPNCHRVRQTPTSSNQLLGYNQSCLQQSNGLIMTNSSPRPAFQPAHVAIWLTPHVKLSHVPWFICRLLALVLNKCGQHSAQEP